MGPVNLQNLSNEFYIINNSNNLNIAKTLTYKWDLGNSEFMGWLIKIVQIIWLLDLKTINKLINWDTFKYNFYETVHFVFLLGNAIFRSLKNCIVKIAKPKFNHWVLPISNDVSIACGHVWFLYNIDIDLLVSFDSLILIFVIIIISFWLLLHYSTFFYISI